MLHKRLDEKMAILPIESEHLLKYFKEYQDLPNQKCVCGSDLGSKEISLSDFILLKLLRERYY